MGCSDLKQRGTFDIITQTLKGHKRPDLVTEASCFIFTAGCIYALDEEGFCREVIPLGLTLPAGVSRCRGAQYVACLDKTTSTGLVPEPRPGARALFVGRGTGQKMALLRTGTITTVEYRENDVKMPKSARASWGAADVELNWSSEDLATKTCQQLPAVQLP